MSGKNFELGEENVFYEFYDLISTSKKNGRIEDVNIEKLLREIRAIELSLEKTLFLKSEFWNTPFYSILDKSLRVFLNTFQIRGFKKDVLFISFEVIVKYFLFLSKETTNVLSEQELNNNFSALLPSSFFNFQLDLDQEFDFPMPKDYFSIDKLEKELGDRLGIRKSVSAEKVIFNFNSLLNLTIYCDNFIAKNIEWNIEFNCFAVISEVHYMTMDLVYEPNKSKIKYPESFSLSFYQITSAIKTIKDLRLEVLEIKRGSIWVRIRLWMKDLLTKEEAKELLQKGKDAVISEYLDKRILEVKKLEGEVKKITTEEAKIKGELSQLLSKEQFQQKISNDLELEQLMIEEKKLNILEKQLNLVSKANELIASGILSSKELDIYINSVLFLKKSETGIQGGGSDIEEIT
ncbi:MAG: hypothetical protein JEZ01_11580 [Labilibaculum sp.]|nr:hypothetical protein [Labilibaculum sp.]MBI9058393.1 hypothetical protein [Labilibaculum sp.]